ncbi:putative membrane protein [Saprospira grandis DSM 2844]|uniref:Putative membrane protein n=1 Tax=Saprospira grandis DSM 2844 TaxID=694433 RepID=J1I7W8_9BACT|nr:RDD family protein [Saprospira grandis]EJF54528.1 putative membrane protein [Saprospira grandis DSM 2844]
MAQSLLNPPEASHRIASFLFDTVFIAILTGCIGFYLIEETSLDRSIHRLWQFSRSDEEFMLLWIIHLGIALGYHFVLEQGRWQASAAKRLLRLRLVNMQGEKASTKQLVLRLLIKGFLLNLGILAIFLNEGNDVPFYLFYYSGLFSLNLVILSNNKEARAIPELLTGLRWVKSN